MTSLYSNRKKAGYSSEEAYFYEENQKLIQQIREKNQKNKKEEMPSNVIEASDRFARKNVLSAEQPSKKAA